MVSLCDIVVLGCGREQSCGCDEVGTIVDFRLVVVGLSIKAEKAEKRSSAILRDFVAFFPRLTCADR